MTSLCSGLVPAVWNFFHSRYGGGPSIVRRTLNIYDAPVALPPPPDQQAPDSSPRPEVTTVRNVCEDNDDGAALASVVEANGSGSSSKCGGNVVTATEWEEHPPSCASVALQQ